MSLKISNPNVLFYFFFSHRPRFRTQNSHSVPAGLEVQDDRLDPRRHRHNRPENVEGVDVGSTVAGLIRRHGHLQVHQAQSGRSGNPALPIARTCAPPRWIRTRQSVQRATARTMRDYHNIIRNFVNTAATRDDA